MLEATKNYPADLGIRLSTDAAYLAASGFCRHMEDYVHVIELPDPDGNAPMSLTEARSYENVDAEYYGGDFGSQVSLPADLSLEASLSCVRAENRTAGRPLSEIPTLEGTVGLRYEVESFFLGVEERIADRQGRVDSSLSETEGWSTMDLKAGAPPGSVGLRGNHQRLG